MKKKIVISLVLIIAIFLTYSHFAMNVTNPDFLDEQLLKIEETIPLRDSKNTGISQADVAWHLDHMLKTVNEITAVLESSNPEDFKSSFSFPRKMSLTMNFIPRGRAESPASLRPPENISTEDIHKQLEEAKSNLKKAFSLNQNTHFEHPIFGTINRAQTLRFIEVHTNHHLKIIADILKTEKN